LRLFRVNSAPKVQNNGYVDAPSKERFTKNVRDLTVLYTCFGYENKTGVERILVIFQHNPMFSLISGKLSPRPFE